MARLDNVATTALSLVLLATPACKKEQKKGPAPTQAPAIAPTAPAKATPVAPVRNKRKKSDDDWRNTRLDAQPPNRAKKGTAAAKTPKKDAGVSDAEVLSRKLAKARVEDEKSLDAKLRGASRRLGACMRTSGAKQANTDVRIRVHRSGYVMSASASGVSSEVQTCISNALSNMRLGTLRSGQGMTIKRTFKLFDKSKTKGVSKKPGK